MPYAGAGCLAWQGARRAAALPLRRHWRRPGMGAGRGAGPRAPNCCCYSCAALSAVTAAPRDGLRAPRPPRPAPLPPRWLAARGAGSQPPAGLSRREKDGRRGRLGDGARWSQRGLGPGCDITADTAACWVERWGTDTGLGRSTPFPGSASALPSDLAGNRDPVASNPEAPYPPELAHGPRAGRSRLGPFSRENTKSLSTCPIPRGQQNKRVAWMDKAQVGP